MKYLFIINPAAGQGKGLDKLRLNIETAAAERNIDYEIVMTEGFMDANRKARSFAKSLEGEEGRIYACGGDGTIGEVVNGVVGFDNVSVGAVPIGTGNDVVRNHPDAGDFLDMGAQIDGTPKKIDLIKYSGIVDGDRRTGYCVNMINIGFDCNVVELAGRLKQKPLIAGSFAYLLAVFGMFIKKKGIALRITEYGEDILASSNVVRDGEMLLCAVCNGSYCGGGIMSAPMSKVDDGVFELNIINNVTRRKFLNIFPKFQKGEHLTIPGIDQVVEVRECVDALLESNNSWDFFICVDGEIKQTSGIRVTMVHEALDFIVPKKI